MPVDYTSLIGQLHQSQSLLTGLLENLDDEQCHTAYQPGMGSLGWYLGEAVYIETLLIREKLQHDDDMTSRVRHLFGSGAVPDAATLAQLPPREHLLNWAMELQEDNLVRLANPKMLGTDPRFKPAWLAGWLAQRYAINYEKMLIVMQARSLAETGSDHMVTMELLPKLGNMETTHVSQGHYRIGAREEETVFDNEQPAQIVELSNYRIAMEPVSNENWMAFMQDGGYQTRDYWTEEGWQWVSRSDGHPWQWRQNNNGRWFEVNLNGTADLPAAEPVSGICHHEACAFANWLTMQGSHYQGAVLQHEYQWETAARLGVIEKTGRVREWCANTFHAYPDYQPPEDPELAMLTESEGKPVLKGVSLHSQPVIRRTSLRSAATASDQHWLSGMRLVFPPGKPFWEQ